MKTISFNCEVVTPMFLGGANQQAELRPPSIRGAMRWWFRAMMGGVSDGNLPYVHKIENQLFGTTEKSSLFSLTVIEKNLIKIQPNDEAPKEKGITYLGYTVFKGNKDKKIMEYSREAFDAGSTFQIQLRSSTNSENLNILKDSLVLALNFGSFGSRSRKGFGSVQLQEIEGEGAKILSLQDIVENYQNFSKSQSKIFSSATQSSFPTFAKGSYVKLKRSKTNLWQNWREAMNDIGEYYKNYRLDPVNQRTPDYLNVVGDFLDAKFDAKKAVNQSNPDLENDVFGLPIQWRSRSRSSPGNNVSAIVTAEQFVNGKIEKLERRASPITIHFGKEEKGIYCIIIFLESKFLPNNSKEVLNHVPGKWPTGRTRPQQITIPTATYGKVNSFMMDIAKQFHVQEKL